MAARFVVTIQAPWPRVRDALASELGEEALGKPKPALARIEDRGEVVRIEGSDHVAELDPEAPETLAKLSALLGCEIRAATLVGDEVSFALVREGEVRAKHQRAAHGASTRTGSFEAWDARLANGDAAVVLDWVLEPWLGGVPSGVGKTVLRALAGLSSRTRAGLFPLVPPRRFPRASRAGRTLVLADDEGEVRLLPDEVQILARHPLSQDWVVGTKKRRMYVVDKACELDLGAWYDEASIENASIEKAEVTKPTQRRKKR